MRTPFYLQRMRLFGIPILNLKTSDIKEKIKFLLVVPSNELLRISRSNKMNIENKHLQQTEVLQNS